LWSTALLRGPASTDRLRVLEEIRASYRLCDGTGEKWNLTGICPLLNFQRFQSLLTFVCVSWGLRSGRPGGLNFLRPIVGVPQILHPPLFQWIPLARFGGSPTRNGR
jgi:hypothetical protein